MISDRSSRSNISAMSTQVVAERKLSRLVRPALFTLVTQAFSEPVSTSSTGES